MEAVLSDSAFGCVLAPVLPPVDDAATLTTYLNTLTSTCRILVANDGAVAHLLSIERSFLAGPAQQPSMGLHVRTCMHRANELCGDSAAVRVSLSGPAGVAVVQLRPCTAAVGRAVRDATSIQLCICSQLPSRAWAPIPLAHAVARAFAGRVLCPSAVIRVSDTCVLHIIQCMPIGAHLLRITRNTRVVIVDDTSVCTRTRHATACACDGQLRPEPEEGDETRALTQKARLAGLDAPVAALEEAVLWPVKHARTIASAHAHMPTGILLHGPAGCGKTALVREMYRRLRALGGEDAASSLLLTVNGPDVLSGVIGETEAALRRLFERALAHARASATSDNAPGVPPHRVCIIFFDEVDAVCPAQIREPQHAPSSDTQSTPDALLTRVRTQLCMLLDDVFAFNAAHAHDPACVRRVIVLGATNRPHSIDMSLRRPGRLEREIVIDPPDAPLRASILQLYFDEVGVDAITRAAIPRIAAQCVGFVGADLHALVRESGRHALARASESALVTLADVQAALSSVHPSALRGVSATRESVSWNDIGGMDDTIRSLHTAVIAPMQHAEGYKLMRVHVPRGILLYGPPGNSKTTLVKALASSVHAAFFAVTGADVYSSYVGDAERTVRDIFARARSTVPSIIFLDEIDTLVGSRGIGGVATAQDVSTSLLATLLTEMDGVQSAEGVIVVGATNRREVLDPALLRPGRLEVHIHVPQPDQAARADILRVHMRKLRTVAGIDVEALAVATPGWSGAELAGLCQEAAMLALREDINVDAVTDAHFQAALRARGEQRHVLRQGVRERL